MICALMKLELQGEGGGGFVWSRTPESRRPSSAQPPCFDDPEDLHPTPCRKTATRLSFLPPHLYDPKWKGCLSYGLCLGQKKNKNAIQPRHVRDVKEDCLPRMCGEFRGGCPGKTRLCAQACACEQCLLHVCGFHPNAITSNYIAE